MTGLYDEDGVDGPFDLRMGRAMKEDALAWARRLGLGAVEHIGMACAGTDKRIAHEYHETRAVNFARKAAHHAFIAEPGLRG